MPQIFLNHLIQCIVNLLRLSGILGRWKCSLEAIAYGNVNEFFHVKLYDSLDSVRNTHVCYLWSHEHYIIHTYWIIINICMAKITRNERKTTCDNASFPCESMNSHASFQSTQVYDTNVCVFHRWPCGIYIEPHVNDNFKYITTWSHI